MHQMDLKTTFFQELQTHLDAINYENVIIAGDFNGTIDNILVKSNTKRKNRMRNEKLPQSFFNLKEKEGLIDIWREKNKKN